MKFYMITAPRRTDPEDNQTTKAELKVMYRELDGKRGLFAREVGRDGYAHWQCRVALSGDLFGWIKRNHLPWHCEECQPVWEYERKDGDYWDTAESLDVRRIRTGRLRYSQMVVLRSVKNQGNRRVTIWVDPKGGFGKTHILIRGVLRGEILPVPAVSIDSKKLSGWVESAITTERIIWIDIPRARRIDTDTWATIEELKNIAYEWRYKSAWKVTAGVSILVTMNNWLTKKEYAQLSKDRWDIHNISEAYAEQFRNEVEKLDGKWKGRLLP